MGGSGSGNWYRWDKKATLEQTKRIDIRYLRKRGFLQPGVIGSLSWTCNGRPNGDIRFQCLLDGLRLIYRYREGGGDWQPVDQMIYYDRTPCHYGGERLWFFCPGCSRRVGVLSGHGRLFLCRHCYQLPYSSQQAGTMDRVIEQKHKLGERIFEHYEYGEGWGKKKGMHWKTFDRLHARYQKLEQQWCQGVAECLKLR